MIDGTRTETFIIINFARAPGHHRRLGLRRRNQEDHLHGSQFPSAAAGRASDALLGQRGERWRCGALLRAFRHRQNHALGRLPRQLIGDDEHGWSENGVFNFEDGCYAKVIRLSPEAEPQIHACTRRFGTILENVVLDPLSRRLDLNDDSSPKTPAAPIRWITSRTTCRPRWPAIRAMSSS